MNSIIQHIIQDLSHLTLPFSPIQIKTIFDVYPEFSTLKDSTDLDSLWVELNVVRQLAEEGILLTDKLKDLRLYDEEFSQYKHSENQLQEQLHELNNTLIGIQHDIECTRKKLTGLFTQLIIQAIDKEDVRKDLFNEMTLHNTPDQLSTWQTNMVLQLRRSIENEIILLTIPTAKKQLLEFKLNQAHLTDEVHRLFSSYGINTLISNPAIASEYINILTTVEHYLDKINELKPQLEQLQEDFITCLTADDINKKRHELQSRKEQLTNELAEIEGRLKASTLTESKKKQLQEEYAAQGVQLLAAYENKINSLVALINPTLWFNLLHEQHAIEQDELNKSIPFLNDLELKKTKSEALEIINSQFQMLQSFPPSPEESRKKTKLQCREKTRELINKLPVALAQIPESFDPNGQVTEYYLLLINHISHLSQKKNDFECLLPKLNDLINQMKQLAELRQRYNLPESQDHLLPSLDRLNRAIPETKLLQKKEEQLALCDIFLDEISLLIEHLKNKREEESRIKGNKTKNYFERQVILIELEKKRHIEYKEPIPVQIHQGTQQLAILQDDLAHKLGQIQNQLQQQAEARAIELAHIAVNPPLHLLPENAVIYDEEIIDALQPQTPARLTPLIRPLTPDTPVIYPRALFFPIDEAALLLDENPVNAIIQNRERTPSPQLLPNIPDSPLPAINEELLPDSPAPAILFPINQALEEFSPILFNEDEPAGLLSPHEEQNPNTPQPAPQLPNTMVPFVNLNPCDDETPINNVAENSLEQWHQHIIAALEDRPESLKQWYLTLYQQALSSANTLTGNKYMHVIRDLFFELHIKKEWHVVSTYQRLCPHPEKNCASLLVFKPHYPVYQESYLTETLLQELPKPLKEFYAHYLKLKSKHPIEAELALQAFLSILSLHQASSNNNECLYKAPLITQDPRYTALKRHRGILALWEQIEDFFRMFVGVITGQAEYHYTQKPCFFNTTTNTLFEEAQFYVEKELSLSC